VTCALLRHVGLDHGRGRHDRLVSDCHTCQEGSRVLPGKSYSSRIYDVEATVEAGVARRVAHGSV
jgi:hypothetical protein